MSSSPDVYSSVRSTIDIFPVASINEFTNCSGEMNDEEKESAVLLLGKNSQPTTAEENRESPNSSVCYSRLLKYVRYVSAEIVIFCFVFVFYYYQFYTQQYLFQWYAIEALKNVTFSLNHSYNFVCYNQTLITELSGSNSTINEVEADAAHMNLIITMAKTVPSLAVNLVISPLSDRYGRKPVMMFVLVSEILAVVLGVIATYLNLNIYWFTVSGFLLGFGGGVSTLLSVSFAYVSDIAPKRWRTLHLGFIQAMNSAAIASSSGIFNIWLQHTDCDFRLPSWLMVAVAFAGFLYSVVLPESLPKQKRIQLNQSKKGIAVLFQGVKIFFWPRLGYSLWKLWFVSLPLCIVVFSESGETSIATLFQLHKPLEWSRNLIGIYGIVRAASHVLGLFVILPLLSVFLKFSDPLIVIIGILAAVGGNIFVGFVKYTWEMFLGKELCFSIVNNVIVLSVKYSMCGWYRGKISLTALNMSKDLVSDFCVSSVNNKFHNSK